MERMGYGLALLIAAGLRLTVLGQQPFTPGEATQAWTAVAWTRGLETLPPAGSSPLLLSLHYFTFLLLDATEAWARFWPALAGALMVLLPWALRRELGRPAALTAALVLAISTVLSFWSRSATGESFAFAATLALLVCLIGMQRPGGQRWAGWAAAALAVLLMSAPVAYSALLALIPLTVIAWRGRQAFAASEAARPAWLQAGLVLLVLLILGSTAFLTQPSGLAALADLPAVWLNQWTQASGYSLTSLLLQLVLDEAFLLVVGIAGLAVGLWRRHPLAPGLGAWLLVGLLVLLRPGRSPADLGVLAVPLALLGGLALSEFASYFRRTVVRSQPWEGFVLFLVGVALLGFTAIWLADYAGSNQAATDRGFLWYALLGIGLLLALLIFYALWFGRAVTLATATLLLLLALLLPSLRAAWEMTHNVDGLRWGSLLHTTGAADGPNLPPFLAQLTAQDRPYGGDLRDLAVSLVAPPGTPPSPLLRWYLRDAKVTEVPGASENSRIIVALADAPLPLSDAYSGRSFRLAQSWTPVGLKGGALWRWLIFGHYGQPLQQERAVVWVRQTGQ